MTTSTARSAKGSSATRRLLSVIAAVTVSVAVTLGVAAPASAAGGQLDARGFEWGWDGPGRG